VGDYKKMKTKLYKGKLLFYNYNDICTKDIFIKEIYGYFECPDNKKRYIKFIVDEHIITKKRYCEIYLDNKSGEVFRRTLLVNPVIDNDIIRYDKAH